ncbi:MAG: hypothetical protein K0U98_00480 [Deltaproteobacteria bacterium]|nr:hypothetical protein [Deltaproteobacteria bacterium]
MLDTLDLSLALDKEQYQKELVELQGRLHRLAFELYKGRRSVVMVYEGWDAAGKGGSIRRITEKLDPRGYQVYAIAAPEGEDREHHYLWRFWRRLITPEDKQIVIFDRTWYGRVLVERVEGFATLDQWKRAFREINEFERQLVDANIILVKLFLHLSKEEQERRFKAREVTPHKKWKLTDEDWRNRSKWGEYELATTDMLRRTSTHRAPWTLIEGDNKYWARIKALRALVCRVEEELPLTAPLSGATAAAKSSLEKKKKKKKKGKSSSSGKRRPRRK